MKTRLLALLVTLSLSQAAYSINYNESSSPELSSNPAQPTQLGVLTNGSNTVTGGIGFGDRDCFTFVIPNGRGLTNLNVLTYNGILDLGNIFIDRGGSSPIPTLASGPSFLGGMDITFSDSGTDILPELASGQFNTTGFTIPLGPGVYTIVFTDTENFPNNYSLDLVVGAGPIGGGGGGGGGGVYSQLYQPRPDQPDLVIGTRRNRGRGNNVYRGNQYLNLRSYRARPVKAFLRLENDGQQEDVYQLRGAGKNRFFNVRYFKKSGGSRNVTAKFLVGTHLSDSLKVTQRSIYEVRVTPARSRLRGRGHHYRHVWKRFRINCVSLIDSLSRDYTSLNVWIDD